MKMIGDRISYKQHDEGYTTIVISTKIDKWKANLMALWLFLFTIVGSIFITFLFKGELSREENIVVFVSIVFWLYFEIRIGKTFLWRKFGIEFIKMDADVLTIKQSILSYGKAKPIRMGTIEGIRAFDQSDKTFTKVMNQSFWVMGQKAIGISYNKGKNEIRIGSQLEEAEAAKLAKFMWKEMQRYKQTVI